MKADDGLQSAVVWYLIQRRAHWLRLRGQRRDIDFQMQAVADVEQTMEAVRTSPAGMQALVMLNDIIKAHLFSRNKKYRVKKEATVRLNAFLRELSKVA